MTLQLHNTLTGKKEEFKPLKPGEVNMYVCGITPYDESHLGHARCYVVFDLLKRVLLAEGYKVRHVQNFTDVDDKIIKRAQETKSDPLTYPKPFMESFKKHMKAFNVLPAGDYPLVTTHIPDIIKLIQKLVDRGFAYAIDGDVYYIVRKFSDYGVLSKRNVDELESGARVNVDERKKDPLDFALWKKAKEGEPFWDSPWGKGRPGWHIECSAMSMKYLGETFDIHGGGLDLVFPHHTNEIAQSEGASGKKFANVWVHNGFVTIDNEKMSKSLGNFFTIKDIVAKFDPMVVRYFLLSQHYRSPLNFSDKVLEVAKTTWVDRIVGAYRVVAGAEKAAPAKSEADDLAQFWIAMRNDLNTPAALAELNQLCTKIFTFKDDKAFLATAKNHLETMLNVLGLIPALEENWPADVLALVKERDEVRKAKNWKRSDEIRDALKAKGLVVEDTSSGPRLKKI